MTADDELMVTSAEGVLSLVLNRPEKRNALSASLRWRLVDVLAAGAADDTVGAVLLSGAGGYFCAGFDLAELAAAPDPAAVFADAATYHETVHGFAKPLVAALEGPVVAGGLDLALMSDIRIASTQATFGQPQVKRGIPASFDLVASIVGQAAASELCLTGRVVDAAEALRMGLVHHVVEPAEVMARAATVARGIADHGSGAIVKQQILDTRA
ncbi:MAG: enoyl-CoA hydratase/isomerase family protein [Actinomycetia bacterium]|nr:enoyl-CoA hydratase/isomerase family protein [Actinomycetes bacterium]